MLNVNSYFPEYELMPMFLCKYLSENWGFQYLAPVSIVASSKIHNKMNTHEHKEEWGGQYLEKKFSLYLYRMMKNPSRSRIFCVPVGMHKENAYHGHEGIRHRKQDFLNI